MLTLLREDRFPAIWIPSAELRDLRALLLHRHEWVRLRTRVQNALQSLALAEGLRRGHGLWSRTGRAELTAVPLAPLASDRRQALVALYDTLHRDIVALTTQISAVAKTRPHACRLMTHPGVGAVTALATEVFVGDPGRFRDAKTLASYVGLIPSEYSSGSQQRLGRIAKQGNRFLRFLWCEAGLQAARREPALGRFYRRKAHQRGRAKARVALGRKLGIRLWILLRDQIDYREFCRRAPATAPECRVCGDA